MNRGLGASDQAVPVEVFSVRWQKKEKKDNNYLFLLPLQSQTEKGGLSATVKTGFSGCGAVGSAPG